MTLYCEKVPVGEGVGVRLDPNVWTRPGLDLDGKRTGLVEALGPSGGTDVTVDRTKAGGVEGHALLIANELRCGADTTEDDDQMQEAARAGIKPGPAFVRFTGKEASLAARLVKPSGPGSVGWPRPVFAPGRARLAVQRIRVNWTARRPVARRIGGLVGMC